MQKRFILQIPKNVKIFLRLLITNGDTYGEILLPGQNEDTYSTRAIGISTRNKVFYE